MHSRHPRTTGASDAEADAWADVLVRYSLLHSAVRAPNGQWLVQHTPDAPALIVDGPAAMVDLAADIQHRIRTTRTRIR
ncbi:hypothetical protein CK936_03120 [Streptomyces albireticuli]|uniref:Uncharacterized protein n=1 Tax=Streptomyces albireticuli TaxID=1940 RepID=A0A2A2DFN7_9ACTN|nr:hypothetical protein CK936_03120 [Streptomyces albireticuli]